MARLEREEEEVKGENKKVREIWREGGEEMKGENKNVKVGSVMMEGRGRGDGRKEIRKER